MNGRPMSGKVIGRLQPMTVDPESALRNTEVPNTQKNRQMPRFTTKMSPTSDQDP